MTEIFNTPDMSGQDIAARVHPDLQPGFHAMPIYTGDDVPLAERRALSRKMIEAWKSATPDNPDVSKQDEIASDPLGRTVRVRVYRAKSAKASAPALVWIHGGGFSLGELDADDGRCGDFALAINGVVVSVDYRLAPEHPYPAGLDDCMTALRWTSFLPGVDTQRIAVGGLSAGGCLAAALALRARDENGPALSFQLLIYPVLDDRHVTRSSRAIADPRVWNLARSLEGWAWYLGPAFGTDVPVYAAPARATDLSALPPAYILAAELDLLCDEATDYAQRLRQAGQKVELDRVAGAFHGFDLFCPDAALTRRAVARYVEALRKAMQ